MVIFFWSCRVFSARIVSVWSFYILISKVAQNNKGGDSMKYVGLILVPLLVVLMLGGPGCSQSQDETAVKTEQAPEKQVEAPVVEETEEIVVEEEELAADPDETETAGKGLMEQVKEKAEEEAGEEIEKIEIE